MPVGYASFAAFEKQENALLDFLCEHKSCLLPDLRPPSAMSETEVSQNSGGHASAIPGCFILSAIITVFGGLIVLYIVMFFVQNKAIAGFTSDEAARIEVLDPTEAQKKSLEDKLFAIKAATSQNKQERILLSKDDLNTLIATTEICKGFRGNTFVDQITSLGIETRMAQPMRKIPFSPEQRYLNATFIFQPELRRRTVALRVIDIISEKGTVPSKFIKSYDTIGFFKLDPENPNIKPYIPRLSRVYTENEHLVIETGTPDPDQAPLPK